jgi:hypothetical protein
MRRWMRCNLLKARDQASEAMRRRWVAGTHWQPIAGEDAAGPGVPQAGDAYEGLTPGLRWLVCDGGARAGFGCHDDEEGARVGRRCPMCAQW